MDRAFHVVSKKLFPSYVFSWKFYVLHFDLSSAFEFIIFIWCEEWVEVFSLCWIFNGPSTIYLEEYPFSIKLALQHRQFNCSLAQSREGKLKHLRFEALGLKDIKLLNDFSIS